MSEQTLDLETLRKLYAACLKAQAALDSAWKLNAIGKILCFQNIEDGPFSDIGLLIQEKSNDTMNRLGDLNMPHLRKLGEYLEANGVELPEDELPILRSDP